MAFTLLVLLTCLTVILGHKVLIHPYSCGFNSHALDALQMRDILTAAGHEVHLLIASDAETRIRSMGYTENVHVFTSPPIANHMSDEWVKVYLNPNDAGGFEFLTQLSASLVQHTEAVLSNRRLVEDLKSLHFDVYIYDIIEEGATILASVLKTNTIAFSPLSYVSTLPGHYPDMPSFMPAILSKLSDTMTFFDRVENCFLDWLVIYVRWRNYDVPLSALAEKYNYTFDYYVTMKTMNFVRGNIALDFPRPIMPNVIDIGGALLSPSQPLGGEFKALADTAKDGLILVSFGSILEKLPRERFETYLNVFGQLRQTVIFRQLGGDMGLQIPDNVFLFDWMPQNDLLGHPNMKIFVTHCGMHSTLETLYNGVPVIAVPVFADQFVNAQKLVSRVKMGRMIHFHSVNEESLYDAIQDVLQNKAYRQNGLKANRTMFDQPVSPREKFLFYIDYIVRHKGAQHLTQENLWRLNGAQLVMLDVYAFLLAILVLCLVGIYFVMRVVLKTARYFFAVPKEHTD